MKKIKPITKLELIRDIAYEGEVSITEATAFYNTFEKVLFDTITSNNKPVVLGTGLGKFVLKRTKTSTRPEMKPVQKKDGTMTFKKTGKTVKYPASVKVTFQISDTLKKAVKKVKL